MEDILESIQTFANGDMLRRGVAVVLIVGITMLVSHALTKLIKRVMQIDGVPLPSSTILVNIGRAAVWSIGLYTLLSTCFNVDVNALVTALGVGGIALTLGMQDTLKNFIGGLQVTLMRIVRPGDHIVVGSFRGIVKDVNWRQTVVYDYERTTHIIPNALINSSGVSKIEPSSIVVGTVVINNDGRDIEAVIAQMERLAKEAIEKVAPLEKDPWILLTQIGEYGAWCKLRFVLESPEFAREALDAALRAIAPLARNNAVDVLEEIEIPA